MVSSPLSSRAARIFTADRFAPAIVRAIAPILAGALCLGGCASGVYPSLERRPGEMRAASAAAAPLPTPAAPLSPLPLDGPLSLDRLRQKAAKAHAQFAALVPQGESAAAAARGSAPDSEAAAHANLALARLHAARNAVSAALAELDRIENDDRIAHALDDGPATPPRPQRTAIAAAQAEVLALLHQEDQSLERLETR